MLGNCVIRGSRALAVCPRQKTRLSDCLDRPARPQRLAMEAGDAAEQQNEEIESLEYIYEEGHYKGPSSAGSGAPVSRRRLPHLPPHNLLLPRQ